MMSELKNYTFGGVLTLIHGMCRVIWREFIMPHIA